MIKKQKIISAIGIMCLLINPVLLAFGIPNSTDDEDTTFIANISK